MHANRIVLGIEVIVVTKLKFHVLTSFEAHLNKKIKLKMAFHIILRQSCNKMDNILSHIALTLKQMSQVCHKYMEAVFIYI